MRKTLLIEDRGFLDFSPCDAGREDCAPSHKFGPHIRNYYLIHFVISGKGTFSTDRGEYALGKGEAFIIKPGEVTVYQADTASRRSLGRISVPMWPFILSDRLLIVAMVGRYPAI